MTRLPDPRPCKGDAYHPYEVGPGLIPEFTCHGCREADVNGGKCAGPRADDVVLVVLAAQIPAVLARGMEDLQRAVDAFVCRVREFVACGHAGGHDDFA